MDPDFALEDLGTTDGTFSSVLNLDGFADGDVEIQGMHYVTTDIWIGGDDSVQLFAGDILLSVNDTESFDGTGANALTVQNSDIFIFRPDVVGNYGAGTFELLMDNMAGSETARVYAGGAGYADWRHGRSSRRFPLCDVWTHQYTTTSCGFRPRVPGGQLKRPVHQSC